MNDAVRVLQPKRGKEVVRELLASLNEFKSLGPYDLHPNMLNEIADGISLSLYIIYGNPWRTGGVRADGKWTNFVAIFEK